MTSLARAIPARGVLCLMVLAATALHAFVALRSPSPWIVPDELIYSELAKSLGQVGLPRIRGEVSFAYGLGYPALLAPIWAIFDDVSTAYAGAKIFNALILSLTAVPSYFLARRFVSEGLSLLVAGLSIAVPSMLYAGTLMTEVALYPTFVLALLAITVALERPLLATQAAALGAITRASAVKMLATALIVAFVAAIVLHSWLEKRAGSGDRGGLKAYRPVWIALAGIVVAGAVVAAFLQLNPLEVLGAYVVVLDNIDLAAVPWWALIHIAELDLYVAVTPFAVTTLVVWRCLRRDADSRERLFVALIVPCCTAVIVVVAAFASTPFPGGGAYPENVTRLHERSTFMLAPLFFIGLALWLRDRPGRQPVVAASVAFASLLPAVIPLDSFLANVRFQALALEPWAGVREVIAWPAGVLAFTFALGLLFMFAIRARVHDAAVVAPVIFVMVMVSLSAQQSIQWASEWTRSVGVGSRPAWIDAAGGERDSVSVVWSEPPGVRFVGSATRHRLVWFGEVFNRSVGRVYELGSPMPYGLPSTPVRLAKGRVLLDNGRAAPLGDLVLVPCHVRIAGAVVARNTVTGASVVRVRNPIRATVTTPESCRGDRPE